MIATRNILIHNYDGVEPGIVWGIIDRDVPGLLESTEKALEDLRDTPS
jgi:uncharacterized protein with HEPN domain